MQKLYPNLFPALQTAGQLSDLDVDVRIALRRGRIRTIVVTASAPGDGPGDYHPCGFEVAEDVDCIGITEALFIESAVLWRQPSMWPKEANPVRWYDKRGLAV